MWFRSTTPDSQIQAANEEVIAGRSLLLDVREQNEWQTERFALARHVPTTAIEALPRDAVDIPGIPKDQRVYVHCAKGMRADRISKRMQHMGYDAVPLVCSFAHMAKLGFRVEDRG